MPHDSWRPRCVRPIDLVHPVRIDQDGVTGPTRAEARSDRWLRVAHGWYVDALARPDVVEQRILEQAARLPPHGAVTAWASLRWRGAAFFDGRGQGGRVDLPVPLIMGCRGNLRPSCAVAGSWEQLAPPERELVSGLPCSTVERALFDEVRQRRAIRPAVVAVDMSLAAGLITREEFAAYVGRRWAWSGVPFARSILPLVDPGSVSPQESLLRLVWTLDAGLPRPLCNPDLVTDSGDFLGRPDLFDPDVGLVGEYDGADHLLEDRRRRDRVREERFRDHGLECVTVVRGELSAPAAVARRLQAAYDRARSTRRPARWSLAG